MSSPNIVFEFHPKKIAFKALTSETNSLQFNLLYNNSKIASSEPLEVAQGKKELDLSHIDCLQFDTKDQVNKYPIIIFVLYGQKNPAKKIILKRSQMMKKYEIEKKNQFNFQEDFGTFSIFYEISIKNNLTESVEFIKQSELLQNKALKQSEKNEDSPSRTLKRPSMLQIGAKAERIRKSSYQVKQSSESPVKIDTSDINVSITKTQAKKVQTMKKQIPNLTLSKEQQQEEKLATQGVKINLFETFNAKQDKQKAKNEVKLRNSHRTEDSKQNDHHSQSHRSHHDHGSTKTSHRQLLPSHDHQDDHHSSHDDSHGHDDHHGGHEQSHSLSFKLKTVILMLIVGFLFLMYDALDDRFSRRVVNKVVVDNHGHENLHHGQVKKKKSSKKQKKVVTH